MMTEIREVLEKYYQEHPEGPFICVDVLADGAIRCYYEEFEVVDCDPEDEESNPYHFYRDDEPLCMEMKKRVEEIVTKHLGQKNAVVREFQETNLNLLKEIDTRRDGLGREQILSLLAAIVNQGLEIGAESIDVSYLYKELNTYSLSLGRVYIPSEIYFEDEDEDDEDEFDIRNDEKYRQLIQEHPWMEEMIETEDEDEMERIMREHYDEFETLLEQNEWLHAILDDDDEYEIDEDNQDDLEELE